MALGALCMTDIIKPLTNNGVMPNDVMLTSACHMACSGTAMCQSPYFFQNPFIVLEIDLAYKIQTKSIRPPKIIKLVLEFLNYDLPDRIGFGVIWI